MGTAASKDGIETIPNGVSKDDSQHFDASTIATNEPGAEDESTLGPSLLGGASTKTGMDAQSLLNAQLAKYKNDDDDTLLQEGRDDFTILHPINDDQVQVNLAMGDLMAYLQVVANNSSNLPHTCRDDPEDGRTVSTLTDEEYAQKSTAFIPADVRVIGGSFTRYGSIWDLSTSQEYNISDGAQEPGRSYGGACANSMLKVLYDSANETVDGKDVADALFDDDEDESQDGDNTDIGTLTLGSLDTTGDYANPTTLKWSTMLRRMKDEVADIGYVQTPTITSSRKLDLDKPFALAPDNFDNKTGKKRSLLIGCNYNGRENADLKASHDDIRSMKDYIVNVHGFREDPELMTVLLDDGEHKPPTHSNITEALKALSEKSKPGDAVFIQFSGHGSRVLAQPVDAEAGYDEVIAPSDYQHRGVIRDTLIFKTLLAPMKLGVTVTILIDTCDTGMVLELPYSWATKSDRPNKTPVPSMVHNDNFSFVRFLKVVKTLYESSAFTQLGKAVGTVLSQGCRSEDEENSMTDNTFETREVAEDDHSRIEGGMLNGGFMDMFSLCTRPADDVTCSDGATLKSSIAACHELGESATLDSLETNSRNASLIDRLVNFIRGDDFSDDESCRTEDYDTLVEDTTVDSMTADEGYESNKRRRSKAKRGRNRRRR